jgi:phosphopantetheine adenylyltransferase
MTIFSLLAAVISLGTGLAIDKPEPKENRFFELRVYTAAPGKLEDLHTRFRDHVLMFFKKHGLTSVGYWVPAENKENKFYYVLAAPSREARDRSFTTLSQDQDFQAMFKASEVNGKVVDKVESTYLTPTDYSPAVRPSSTRAPRIFELRTYHTVPGKLADLHARFRDHTMQIFEKHGMKNVGYWTPLEKEKGSEDTLVYFLAFKDAEAAKKSWDAFRADPDWVKAKDESEKNGKLVEKVDSVYLKPTDYSPIK